MFEPDVRSVELDAGLRSVPDALPLPPEPRLIDLAEFLRAELPSRRCIMEPWLPHQGLAMVYGPRGVGKTWLALSIAYAIAGGGELLGWRVPRPVGVAYLDGEMPANVIQERLSRIVASADYEASAPLKILTPDLQPDGPDLNLSLREHQEALERQLDGIEVIMLDSISTLCGVQAENDADSWLPIQEWALRQRRKGRSVVFCHHANKQGAQRGTSRREDVLDTVVALKRPRKYRPELGATFELSFEKNREFHGEDAASFNAALQAGSRGPLCWTRRELELDTCDRVVALTKDGLSQSDVAKELGKDKSTVSRHVRAAQKRGDLP